MIARKTQAYDVAVPTELQILREHFGALDASGAPAIELSIGTLLFTLEPSGDRWTVEEGEPKSPAFAVSVHWADLIDLIEGYGSVDAALIDGRLRIAGDLVLAMRWVPRLFRSSGSRPGPSSSSRGT